MSRDLILATALRAGRAHVSSSLSCLEILAVPLFCRILPGRLRGIDCIGSPDSAFQLALSKAHGSLALYSLLVAGGRLPPRRLRNFKRPGPEQLPPEPDAGRVPLAGLTTGPLGTGLAAMMGVAMGRQRLGRSGHYYVILSDGELQKGQTLECLGFIPTVIKGSFVVVVDVNAYQIDGPTRDVSATNLTTLFRATGWQTSTVDGHSIVQLRHALKTAFASAIPTAIVAKTVKGHSVPILEAAAERHYYKGEERLELRAAIRKAEVRRLIPEVPRRLSAGSDVCMASARDHLRSSLTELAARGSRIAFLSADLLNSTGLPKMVKLPSWVQRFPVAENAMFRAAEGLLRSDYDVVIGIYESLLAYVFTELQALVRAACTYKKSVLVCAAKPGRISDDGPSMRSFATLAGLSKIRGLRVADPLSLPDLTAVVARLARTAGDVTILRVADELARRRFVGVSRRRGVACRPAVGLRKRTVLTHGWMFGKACEVLRPESGWQVLGLDRPASTTAAKIASFLPHVDGQAAIVASDYDPDGLQTLLRLAMGTRGIDFHARIRVIGPVTHRAADSTFGPNEFAAALRSCVRRFSDA